MDSFGDARARSIDVLDDGGPSPWSLLGPKPALTCIIPAFNEAASIRDTVESVLSQSEPPEVVIVVDDGSTDGTGDLAEQAGAIVIRPTNGTGSKAGAQSFALPYVEAPFTMVLAADSVLLGLLGSGTQGSVGFDR